MTDMMINLYNGRPYTEFEKNYSEVVYYLDMQRRYSQSKELYSEKLLTLFEEKIKGIVRTVKDKLNEDAKTQNLIQIELNKAPSTCDAVDHDGCEHEPNPDGSEYKVYNIKT